MDHLQEFEKQALFIDKPLIAKVITPLNACLWSFIFFNNICFRHFYSFIKHLFIISAIFIPSLCYSQFQVNWVQSKQPNWDSGCMVSLCGLDSYCCCPEEHWYNKQDKQVNTHEPDGVAIYGVQQAFLGVWTKVGFIVTKRRNHLAGKPQDRELLENTEKLLAYLQRYLN